MGQLLCTPKPTASQGSHVKRSRVSALKSCFRRRSSKVSPIIESAIVRGVESPDSTLPESRHSSCSVDLPSTPASITSDDDLPSSPPCGGVGTERSDVQSCLCQLCLLRSGTPLSQLAERDEGGHSSPSSVDDTADDVGEESTAEPPDRSSVAFAARPIMTPAPPAICRPSSSSSSAEECDDESHPEPSHTLVPLPRVALAQHSGYRASGIWDDIAEKGLIGDIGIDDSEEALFGVSQPPVRSSESELSVEETLFLFGFEDAPVLFHLPPLFPTTPTREGAKSVKSQVSEEVDVLIPTAQTEKVSKDQTDAANGKKTAKKKAKKHRRSLRKMFRGRPGAAREHPATDKSVTRNVIPACLQTPPLDVYTSRSI